MARERSPNRDKAFKLWVESGRTRKLASIARELGISPGMVRKWKHIDKWDELPDPRPGAPKGNKNAAGNRGGRAPIGNRNAKTHGAYQTMWMTQIEAEDKFKLMKMETDPRTMLENELRLLEYREYRMMKRYNEIMDGWDESSVSSKYEFHQGERIGEKAEFDADGTLHLAPVHKQEKVEVERTVKTSQKLERLMVIETGLTAVQDKKHRYIDLLSKLDRGELSKEEMKLRLEKMKLEINLLKSEEW